MDLSNAFGVLLGAVIGALGSYYASYYAVTNSEQKKTTEAVSRLHCLLILEVSSHQVNLAREIDGLLPFWSQKGNPSSYENLKREIYYVRLSVSYFRQFLGDLIHSPLLLGIAYYYRNVEWLNQECTKLEQDKDNDILVDSYVRGCAEILEASIHFMEDLLEARGIERYKSVQLNAKRDDFKSGRNHYLKLVASIKGT